MRISDYQFYQCLQQILFKITVIVPQILPNSLATILQWKTHKAYKRMYTHQISKCRCKKIDKLFLIH